MSEIMDSTYYRVTVTKGATREDRCLYTNSSEPVLKAQEIYGRTGWTVVNLSVWA